MTGTLSFTPLINSLSGKPSFSGTPGHSSTAGDLMFKRTIQFVNAAIAVVSIVFIKTKSFYLYSGGILVVQSIFTVSFLGAIYFSYLYQIIDEYKTSSLTDPLTELYNRHHFLDAGELILRFRNGLPLYRSVSAS